jgi:pyrroloquinoline quinone (PQQ) biosynthesis protein C
MLKMVLELDTEKDIKKEAKRLVKDNGWEKAHALSFLHSKYQSENRIEEAAIVGRLISEEESDSVREYDES